MKKITAIVVLLSLILVLFCPIMAFADEETPPYPYYIEVGENLVFYMVPYGPEEYADPEEFEKYYPKSGMYTSSNPEERELVYLFSGDEYFTDGDNEIFFSNDGKYMIGSRWWTYSDYSNAISFYDEGVLLRTYTIDELIKSAHKLKYTASHVMWDDQSKRSFDEENNTYTVYTLDDQKIVFDVTTGEIIENDKKFVLSESVLYILSLIIGIFV